MKIEFKFPGSGTGHFFGEFNSPGSGTGEFFGRLARFLSAWVSVSLLGFFQQHVDLGFQHVLLAFGKAHVPEDSPSPVVDNKGGWRIDYPVDLMGDILVVEQNWK